MNAYQFVLSLAGKWPLVIGVVAIVAIIVCREEVRDFIKRIYRISPTGGVTAARQNPQIVASNTGSGAAGASPDFVRQISATVDPYVLDQRANAIYAEFDSRGIGPGNREEHLIPLLAAALTRESWERIYLWIFGSQIRLLLKLNESPQGMTEAEVRGIYQTGVDQNPETYHAYPFENWIFFMEATTLTRKEDDRHLITPYGRSFLKYLVGQGLTFDKYG